MTEFQECFDHLNIDQLWNELFFQMGLGFTTNDSVCTYILDRIDLLTI